MTAEYFENNLQKYTIKYGETIIVFSSYEKELIDGVRILGSFRTKISPTTNHPTEPNKHIHFFLYSLENIADISPEVIAKIHTDQGSKCCRTVPVVIAEYRKEDLSQHSSVWTCIKVGRMINWTEIHRIFDSIELAIADSKEALKPESPKSSIRTYLDDATKTFTPNIRHNLFSSNPQQPINKFGLYGPLIGFVGGAISVGGFYLGLSKAAATMAILNTVSAALMISGGLMIVIGLAMLLAFGMHKCCSTPSNGHEPLELTTFKTAVR